MSNSASAPIDPFYFELMGRAAMALKSQRDLLRVVEGGRRMLDDRTPRPAIDLKIIKGENQQMSVKILLAGSVTAWRDLALTRKNQTYRNALARDLQIIANQISNLAANEGVMAGLRWRLEVEPVATADTEEAA